MAIDLEDSLNAEITELQVAVWLCAAVVASAATLLLLRQHQRARRQRRRMLELEALGLHIPPTLHPVIDPELCISSAACVTACPEGDVIGLVEGAGRLLHGAACIGHGKCATECPVDAIQLVFGTAQRGIDIPHVTPDFETNRSGVYIAGELGGMGLIRNAIRQGVGATRHAISKRDAGHERATGRDRDCRAGRSRTAWLHIYRDAGDCNG